MHLPSPEEFQQYLHRQIPISQAMGVFVASLSSEKVVIGASFEPNVNHRGTVFGGSLAAIATLSCWGLVYLKLIRVFAAYEIVVTHSEISYIRPVQENFYAESHLEDQTQWQALFSSLERRGKGRIQLQAYIGEKDHSSVKFKGTFAVLSRKISS